MKNCFKFCLLSGVFLLLPLTLFAQNEPAKYAQQGGAEKQARLWTVGASAATSFNTPWLIGTVRGTIAPFNYSFLEIGFDVGLMSGVSGVGLYSLGPFIHYAYFLPINSWIGWYAGAGGGYIMANFSFSEGDAKVNDFVADAVSGVSLFDVLDVSYTLRTNFSRVTNKISVGYTYRFK